MKKNDKVFFFQQFHLLSITYFTVNDGIDLLIEAIKSAPDVKPIKKKVLQANTLHHAAKTNKIESASILFSNLSNEDSSFDYSNKQTKEENDTSYIGSETAEQNASQGNDKDQLGKIIFDDTNTEAVYYKKDTDTTDPPLIMFETTIVPRAYGRNRAETTEHNNFDKLEKAVKEETKKIEVYIGDVEEEDNVEVTTTTTLATDLDVEGEPVTITVPMETTEFRLPEVKERQKNINSVDVSGSSDGDKRIPLDWIDEGDEQDTKEIRSPVNKTTTQRAQTIETTTKVLTTTKKPERLDNISSITKELGDEFDKKRNSINVEDVMFKKQMDLLNSLDYGTEKSDVEDSESKDGDERFGGDAFPSYFV